MAEKEPGWWQDRDGWYSAMVGDVLATVIPHDDRWLVAVQHLHEAHKGYYGQRPTCEMAKTIGEHYLNRWSRSGMAAQGDTTPLPVS